MANTIDQAFIKQFETEVHMAYQRMGSKLRNTVRTTNVTGSTARFQKSALARLPPSRAMAMSLRWNWHTPTSKLRCLTSMRRNTSTSLTN
jgi:hypothetical protein